MHVCDKIIIFNEIVFVHFDILENAMIIQQMCHTQLFLLLK